MNKWVILNKEQLPKDNKGVISKIDCVGLVLKFKCLKTKEVCDIKILKYIKGNGKINNKFLIEYVFLKDYEDYKEVIVKEISCGNLIINETFGGIIPSLNQWKLKDGYWEGTTVDGIKFKFSTDNKETERRILHNTWTLNSGYLEMVHKSERWKIHRAIMFDFNKENSDSCELIVDHINKDKLDNRKYKNLRLVTYSDNCKNRETSNSRKGELVGLRHRTKSNTWYSVFEVNNKKIIIKTKNIKEEAELDNLIAQRYLNCMHNSEQFWRIENLSKERIKEVVEDIEMQINGIKKINFICIFPNGDIIETTSIREMGRELKIDSKVINKLIKSGEPYRISKNVPINKRDNLLKLEGIKIYKVENKR